MKTITFTGTGSQVRDGTQTVTRRKKWLNLRAGARLMAVERLGGSSDDPVVTVEIGEVEVLSARRERLDLVTQEDVALEGFPDKAPEWFVTHFVQTHGGTFTQEITRIEFRRIESQAPQGPITPAEEPAGDADAVPERACRECGCTDERACATDPPCHWVEHDLCSACDTQEWDDADQPSLEDALNTAARAVADHCIELWDAGSSDSLNELEAEYLTLRGLADARTHEERIAAYLEPYLDEDQLKAVVSGIASVTRAGASLTD